MAKSSKMGTQTILDPCCGSKMFYYDKNSNAVMFGDIREIHTRLCDGRELHIQPDELMDVTNMKDIANDTFNCIIFDPPHLVRVGESSWLAQKYGHLPLLWEEWMNKAFAECFRVLKPGGMLLFKWNEEDIPHHTVLRCALPYKPIAGDRTGKTRWTFFYKHLGGNNNDQKFNTNHS